MGATPVPDPEAPPTRTRAARQLPLPEGNRPRLAIGRERA